MGLGDFLSPHSNQLGKFNLGKRRRTMSRLRLLPGFLGALLVLAPTATFSQQATNLWMAVAAATWNDPSGTAHVAIGYSGSQTTEQAATNEALTMCQADGGQGCQAYGPWNSGCAFIVAGSNTTGVSWWADNSEQNLINQCRSAGYTCNYPIGGCLS
jgi:hypothetical protein